MITSACPWCNAETAVGFFVGTEVVCGTCFDSSPICAECRQRYHTRWLPGALDPGYCFSCTHWRRRASEAASPRSVVVDHVAYWIEDDLPARTPGFRGFGGARFSIRFDDGRCVETRNLWCQGSIPERFHDRLPNNAILLQEGERDYGPVDMATGDPLGRSGNGWPTS